MNKHNERAAFEKFFVGSNRRGVKHATKALATNEHGDYVDDSTQRHWWTWQNAMKAAMLEAQRPALKPMTDEQKQAMRLYKAVERLALQAGEDTDESVDWLCGEHGGMFKLYEAYFSPKKPDGTCPTCESLSRAVMDDHVFHDKLTKPLTDERLEEMWEADTTSSEDCKSLYFFKLVARAIEAAHGIKEQA